MLFITLSSYFENCHVFLGYLVHLRLKECNANSEIDISYLQYDVTQKHYVLVSCYEDYDHFHYK